MPFGRCFCWRSRGQHAECIFHFWLLETYTSWGCCLKKKKHLNVCLPLLLLPWLFHSAVGSLYLTTTMPKTIKTDETVDIVLTLFTWNCTILYFWLLFSSSFTSATLRCLLPIKNNILDRFFFFHQTAGLGLTPCCGIWFYNWPSTGTGYKVKMFNICTC